MLRVILTFFTLLAATAAEFSQDTWNLYKEAEASSRTLDQRERNLERTLRQTDSFPYVGQLKDFKANNVTLQCVLDFRRVVKELEANESQVYALEMADSMGKSPSGLFLFNVVWMGSFQQCIDVVAIEDDEELFKGKYCKSSILPLTIAFCFPDSCSSSDVQIVVQAALDVVSGEYNSTGTTCVEDIPYRTEDIIALVICGILGACVLIGSTYDVFLRNKGKQEKQKSKRKISELHENAPTENGTNKTPNGIESTEPTEITKKVSNGIESTDIKPQIISTISTSNQTDPAQNGSSHTVEMTPGEEDKPPRTKRKGQGTLHKILMSFSAFTNAQKLFSLRKNPNAMDCLNGIRALTISWVILGHTYNFSGPYTANLRDWVDFMRRWTFQLICNAFLAVDTFFFLSGFLVALGTLKALKKRKGKMNWPMYYVHRYLRLTPLYAFLLMLLCTLFLHAYYGPFSDTADYKGPALDVCRRNWWKNLLYINNFDRKEEQCMGWSWYLSNDMQFFVISPLFIYALYRNRKVGYGLLTASLLSCMLANGIMAQKYDIPAASLATLDSTDEKSKYFNRMYRRPYYRIAPYVVGIAFGDILFYIKDRKKNFKIPMIANLFWWAAAIAINVLLVYSQYPLYRDRKQFDLTIGALYYATSKTAWALTLGYIVVACCTGNGGPINWFLSWRIWQPIARLSYGAYLIHPMVMIWYYGAHQYLIFSHDYTMAYLFLGNMCLTFAGAIIASLAVEAPFMRLENIVFGR